MVSYHKSDIYIRNLKILPDFVVLAWFTCVPLLGTLGNRGR